MEYGYALMRGKRSQMEDFTYADFVRDASGRQVGCFGVFDGHGGPDAAHFVRDRLLHNIMQHKDFNAYPEKAIEESFLETDKQYLASEVGPQQRLVPQLGCAMPCDPRHGRVAPRCQSRRAPTTATTAARRRRW